MGQPKNKQLGRTGAPPLRSSIKSLDAALVVLTSLARFDHPVSLTELSNLTKLPMSKVHRYLASFVNVGLVSKHRSGRYELGKGAVELGLAAMARAEIVNRAADRLEDLAERTTAAALLAVWGTNGPVIVRWQRNPRVIISSLGLGTSMPLLNSASGRVFLGYAEESVIRPQLDQELRKAKALGLRWPDLEPTLGGVQKLREKIRRDGYATDKLLISGHYSVSAPVLNWQNEVEAAITLVSTDPRLLHPNAGALEDLVQTCREASIISPGNSISSDDDANGRGPASKRTRKLSDLPA